ncbi:MAG: hypothetical protein OXI46_00350 [Gemmatimonadota bacterium]|nr:hypothetical protein [Gemmatimonadota bacterium]
MRGRRHESGRVAHDVTRFRAGLAFRASEDSSTPGEAGPAGASHAAGPDILTCF